MSLRHRDPYRLPLLSLDGMKINPYVEKIQTALTLGDLPILTGEILKDMPGKWSQAGKPLVVEVGCHKGRTLVGLAKQFPDSQFVGIDLTYKRVFTTAQRSVAAGVSNVRSVLVNAKFLEQLFASQEVGALLIYFPDPWSKKAGQLKHRLIDNAFMVGTYNVLKPGGIVCFKTDHLPYFEAVTESAAAAGFQMRQRHDWGNRLMEPVTVFEEKFKALKVKTYSIIFEKLA